MNHLFWGTPIFENTQMTSELGNADFLKVQFLNFLPIPGVYILKTLTRLELLLFLIFFGLKKNLMKPTTNHQTPSTKQRTYPQTDTSSGIHLAYGFFFGFHVTFQHAPLWRLVFHCREKSASMVGVRWTKFPRKFGGKNWGGCGKNGPHNFQRAKIELLVVWQRVTALSEFKKKTRLSLGVKLLPVLEAPRKMSVGSGASKGLFHGNLTMPLPKCHLFFPGQ